MNMQNPSFHPYAYGDAMPQQFPTDFPQSQFQQPASFSNVSQPAVHFPPQQAPQQTPPHLYPQFQQHQQQQQQQQAGGFARPASRESHPFPQGKANRA